MFLLLPYRKRLELVFDPTFLDGVVVGLLLAAALTVVVPLAALTVIRWNT